MSRIRANQITNQAADGAPTVQHGLIIAGVSTFTGSVSIGGTLTYEDVTNIDSVGIITAGSGIDCNGTLEVSSTSNFDGDVQIADTILHLGDTNTKIRFPAADTITAETGGSERLRIDSSGRVHIGGVTGPNSAKLFVSGTNSNSYVTLRNTSAGDGSGARWNSIRFQGTQSGGEVSDLVQLQANHDGTADDEKGSFQILVNDGNDGDSLQERLRITSAGQMVMGANTSKAKFEIKDNGYSSSTVLQRISGDDANPYALIIANDTCNSAAASGLQFFVSDSGEHYIRARASSTAGNNNLRLVAQNNVILYSGSSETERLRINSSGYVTKPNQASFTARSTGTWSHGSSTGYLDIDINMVEEFDVGSNYNGQIFTAPVAGKYFFSYTFQYKCTSGYLVVYLQKGVSGSYNSYGRMHVYPPQQSTVYSGPSIIGIMDLAAGNTVKPVAEVNYAGNQVANVNFSGYLLG